MEDYSFVVLGGILFLTIAIVLYSVPKLIELAQMKKLFDDYKDERKIHNGFIPNIGGAAIIIAFLVSFSLHPASSQLAGFEYLVAASIIVMAIGLKDDLLVISSHKKLLGEMIIATIMIFGAGVTINSFGGVFGVHELPYAVSVLASYAVIIVLINAMNLIDGIDGLAASVTAAASLLFGIWFFMAGHYSLFVCSLVVSVCYTAFLVYNWSPAKVFMGDTGSLFAGFMLSFLAIHFLETGVYGSTIASWQAAVPVVLVAVLVIPLYDTLRVFLIRLWKKTSPFEADDNHVHHHFIRHGFTHSQSTMILIAINLFILGTTLFLAQYLTINWLLFTVVALALVLLPTVHVKRRVLSLVQSQSPDRLQRILSITSRTNGHHSGNGQLSPKDYYDRRARHRNGEEKQMNGVTEELMNR